MNNKNTNNTNNTNNIDINNNNTNNDEFQQQMDQLLQLVTNRTQGQINDDVVENAVSSILLGQTNNNGKNSNHSNTIHSHTKKISEKDVIIQDEDDYDNIDDNNTNNTNNTNSNNNTNNSKKNINHKPIASTTAATATTTKILEPKWTGPKVTIESIEQQDKKLQQYQSNKSNNNNNNNNNSNTNNGNKHNNKDTKINELNEQWSKLDHIPLGKLGARMMVTFGDNIHTDPDALQSALHGTRQCLQNAIQDARALKRKMKQDYERAKVMVNLHRMKRKQRSVLKEETDVPRSGNVDPDMMFQAIGGYSKIGYEPKCGFDHTQLEKLFPEEMNAYQRWRRMHKAYTESDDSKIGSNGQNNNNNNNNDAADEDNDVDNDSGDDGDDGDDIDTNQNDNDDDNNDDNDDDNNNNNNNNNEWGGHLKDRLAQFDARTDRMKEDWYMAFSVVRQGSFLSRSLSAEDRKWEKARKGKGRGKRKATWENLPASYIQFLHWVGFDHRSALPPPNEETTEALAFLGYDFMGKIVEKAIFLRCLALREESRLSKYNSETQNDEIILELGQGEQLSKQDIERALNDSSIGVKPLYSATNSVLDDGSSIQLYFGPGFEDRIEMELEQ